MEVTPPVLIRLENAFRFKAAGFRIIDISLIVHTVHCLLAAVPEARYILPHMGSF